MTSEEVLDLADKFFPALALASGPKGPRTRSYSGALGTVTISARPEGGHYMFVEAVTDQTGESRLDRNVKRFFVHVHREADPAHRLAASY
jgi:hypothetical protein